MTFNNDADISGDRARGGGGGRSRGRTGAAVGGGIGGLGLIVVLLFQVFTGQNVDLSGLTGQDQAQYQPEGGESVEECLTGQDANERIECRMDGTGLSLDQFWEVALPEQAGVQYVPPPFQTFAGQVSTACGAATSAVGPFYCPGDQTVYLDTTFFEELTTRFGAQEGPLAELYVVAHEFGHHIQNQLGTMNAIDRTGTGPTSDAVRLELQADCYAGMWVAAASETKDANGVSYLVEPTQAELEQALSAAAAVGDDHIQETFSGQVTPHTWTHGSSAQRQKWFDVGLNEGTLRACDTFAVSGDAL